MHDVDTHNYYVISMLFENGICLRYLSAYYWTTKDVVFFLHICLSVSISFVCLTALAVFGIGR